MLKAMRKLDTIVVLRLLENLGFPLHFQDDEEIEEGIKHIRTTFMNEISQLPTVLDETYLIIGSA